MRSRKILFLTILLGCAFVLPISSRSAQADTRRSDSADDSDRDSTSIDSEAASDATDETDHSPERSSSRRRRSRTSDSEGPAITGRVGHTAFETFGRNESISHAELFPHVIVDDNMLFGDARLFLSNRGRIGGNVGFGYRRWVNPWESVLGASFWYDADETTGELFNELGLSLETYSRYWDFRTNLYFPIGGDQKDYNIRLINPQFVGNQVYFQQWRDSGEAMEGLDLEIGILPPIDFCEDHQLRAYAGWYHFVGDIVDDIDGYKVRVEGNVTDNISAQVEMTDDDVFGTNVTLGVTIALSSAPTGSGAKPWNKGYAMRRFVQRNYNVIVSRQTETSASFAAVNPSTGLPYVVQHVSSAAAGPGTGAVDDPFATIADAQTAGADIVLVHADSVLTAPLVQQDDDVILGEGVGHLFNVANYGQQWLPTATAGVNRPTLQSVTGDAVTLADNTRFAGFVIDSPTGYGIYGNGATGADISNVDVLNAQLDGIFLQNATGTFSLANVQIDDAVGNAFHVDGGTSDVTFTGTINNAAGRALLVENTTDGTIDLANATIASQGGQGLAILNVDGNVTLDDVTIQDSTATGIDIQGGAGTVTFAGTTTVENSAGAGISIQDATGEVSFANIDVTSDGQTGLYVRNSDDVTINDGTIEAVNNGAAADIEGSETDISLTSVSSDGGPFGVRIVDSTGQFVVYGNGTTGSGGLIQNATTAGVWLDNAGTVALQYMELDANNVAIQSSGTDRLSLAQSLVTNSTTYGIDAMNTNIIEVTHSDFTDNGNASVRARADALGSHSLQFLSNLVSESTGGILDLSTSGSGNGSTLTLYANNNDITTEGSGVDAIRVDWSGPLAMSVTGNVFTATGDSSTGVNVEATSATDSSQIEVSRNYFDFEGIGSTGVKAMTWGTSALGIASNTFTFDGANGVGMDFWLAQSASVNVTSNIVTDNVSGGTGVLFRSISGPSSVAINNNLIDLLSETAILDRGFIFSSVDETNGTVTLSGTYNNIVNGATQSSSVPADTTSGWFFVNGTAVP